MTLYHIIYFRYSYCFAGKFYSSIDHQADCRSSESTYGIKWQSSSNLGDHWEVVDHIGVDDGVDDGLAHLAPARVIHVSQHIRIGLIRQQGVQQGHVAVLQDAVVIVHPRKLVPRRDQERIVEACAAVISSPIGQHRCIPGVQNADT